MGVEALIATAVAVAGALGGFFEGKRRGAVGTASIANNTVNILEAQVEALLRDKSDRDAMIDDLRQRVEVLEGLVTQRAEVKAVHEDVKAVRSVVTQIARKVGAA